MIAIRSFFLVLLNRAHVSRWGVWIGTVTIAFRHPEPARAAAE